MMRLGAAFVAVCMVLIAGSLAAILYLWVGLTGIEAGIAGLAVLTAMVVYNFASPRIRDQEVVSQQIADLSRGTADLASKVGEIGRRIEAAEMAVATAVEKTRAASAPLSGEIETLGTLVKQLAESVAAHEAGLARHLIGGAPPGPGRRREPAPGRPAGGRPRRRGGNSAGAGSRRQGAGRSGRDGAGADGKRTVPRPRPRPRHGADRGGDRGQPRRPLPAADRLAAAAQGAVLRGGGAAAHGRRRGARPRGLPALCRGRRADAEDR